MAAMFKLLELHQSGNIKFTLNVAAVTEFQIRCKTIIGLTSVVSSPNSIFEHSFEWSRWDDSYKWSTKTRQFKWVSTI